MAGGKVSSLLSLLPETPVCFSHRQFYFLFFLAVFQAALTLQSSQDYFISLITSGRESIVPVLGKTLNLFDCIVSFVKWK